MNLRALFRPRLADMTGALRWVGGAAIGIAAWSSCGPEPEPQYRDVIVPEERIVEVEKIDTVVTFVEKVRYVHTPAVQVATAPDAGEPDVATFCAETVAHALAKRDSTAAPPTPPALLLRSVRMTDPWFIGRAQLIATGPLSDGDLRQTTHRVRGGFEARVHADSVIVRYPRHALLKQLAEFGIVFAAGYLVGEVLP